ncbi:mitotic-spindle organizing protein 2A [Trichonephila clavipes]|nr:mitotic-spindle organizing protein 2A [Trichonephila clavipes]
MIEWCMREKLIAIRYECPKCEKDMVLRESKGTIDGYEWRCCTKGESALCLQECKKRYGRASLRTVIGCLELKGIQINAFLRVVANRMKEELLGVIKEWVVPGSVIILDCWKAYNCLSHEGYQHLRVNHSLTFMDPETGAHTNSIKGMWSAIKRLLRNHPAHVEGEFDHYLAKYMWRRRREHSMDDSALNKSNVAAVAEWYRYRTVACFVTGSSPVPLKTRRVGQRCTLNLSRAETSSRWCGVVVRRGGASSGVVHVT